MNEKVKNWFGKHKWHIVCGIVSAVLIVGWALNIYYACKSDEEANIFTAISGWVGFLATAGVGGITIYQNKRSERNFFRQSEINKLINLRETIHADLKLFADNDYTAKIILKSNHDDFTRLVLETLFIYKNFCIRQANEINNIRYNFQEIPKIHELLIDICIGLNELKTLNKKEFDDKIIQLNNKHHKIVDYFTDLLTDIDNAIEELSDKNMGYKNFLDKLDIIKNYDKIRPQIEKNTERYKEETQNGQAEDDVDGQGE